MIIAAAALLFLYFSTSLVSFIISAILIGIAYGLNWSPLLAFVSDRIESGNNGRVFGNFFLFSALGEAIARLLLF
jgi:MFS family permease